jgi:hypothetical protein
MASAAAQATPKVYAAIAGVMADLAKEGIAKARNNQQQGYNFRGIDDVYNALSPVLAAHGLVVLPRVLSRDVVERVNHKGTALFYVTVDAEFTLVCAKDGSSHTIKTFGEAMDSGDKATNKAMSAAYKYAAMQAFCIPTEGDNDADSTTHEVAPQPQRQHVEPPKQTLAQRADVFEAKLRAAKTSDALEKTLKLGSGLMADLDAKDPDRFVELTQLHGEIAGNFAAHLEAAE